MKHTVATVVASGPSHPPCLGPRGVRACNASGPEVYARLMSTRNDTDFLNGVPELLILRLVARQPMYGYEIVQAIRLSTDDVLRFGEGCVYPVLHRLADDGLLA